MQIVSSRILGAVAAASWLFSAAQPAPAQDTSDDRLGRVHFSTSCNESRNGGLTRHAIPALVLVSRVKAVRELRPTGMCDRLLGVALSLLFNPHVPPPAQPSA
jgi:hypothetical protein